MSSFKASLKIAAFLLWSLLLVPPQIIVLLFHRGKYAYTIPFLWENGVRTIFQIRYSVEGIPLRGHQVFYMSNHLSYLDVPLLGSILKASFVAKSEVEKWPVFGFLSKLQQTEFIERRRTAIADETNKIAAKVASGRSLIIFPEGTSTSGYDVEPFKSSLFTLALGEGNEDIFLQPVTIRLDEVSGRAPATKDERDLYAWPRDLDMGLPPHLWRFAKTSGARLTVTFHPPVRARDFTDRKMLAKTCHDSVSKGLKAA
ncbi:MAG: 1-acyl-sn-glycerol-3-phosphate acyltransferase [Alphaproteobacteria bacterium PRO2]|nr:1-acyl-sn-glycerol-3-phosphate acyltransferase [Alphaproteobacteria bacterium PRO2]